MKHYHYSKLEDFLEDDSFRKWVYEADQTSAQQWEDWLKQYPEKFELINHSREILLAVKGELPAISQQEVRQEVGGILQQLDRPMATERVLTSSRKNSYVWWAAASILLVLGVSMGIWFTANRTNPVPTYVALVKTADLPLIEVANEQNQPIMVNLPDGSTVLLQQNSRLSYPKAFRDKCREVYLTGEAFFEVHKNPAQPFFVYANELVTQVLGTSFRVTAYEQDLEVKVVVKTGVVSVFSAQGNQAFEQKPDRSLQEVVLTPAQQAVFSREDGKIARSSSAKSAELPIETYSFEFNRTPVVEVLQLLEKAYGVSITFDSEKLAGCTFTASLGDEPLFEKLRLITTVTESSFEVINEEIIIHSNGCK
jgi:ferric-dicitrate binding protein FerR (iron transport regulator)